MENMFFSAIHCSTHNKFDSLTLVYLSLSTELMLMS